MVNYRKGTKNDGDAIIELINYVFSFDHCPHDFKKRNPAMYDSDYPFWNDHYVAEEDGKLLATLSVTKKDWNGFICGHIGQVAVHPYHRGRGFMKVLMKMANEDMKKEGFLFGELNGLRQRYEYFGYTQGGVIYNVKVTPTNLRHKPGNTEGITLKETSYHQYTAIKNGTEIGRVSDYGAETTYPEDLPAVLQLYFEATGNKELNLRVKPYDAKRLAVLTEICENISSTHIMQYCVFRLRDAIKACLEQRQDLWDGSVTFAPDTEAPFTVTVEKGKVTVTDANVSETTDFMTLQRQLFCLVPPVLLPKEMAQTNWFPLSFMQ